MADHHVLPLTGDTSQQLTGQAEFRHPRGQGQPRSPMGATTASVTIMCTGAQTSQAM
jgi:hypothetical protein